MPFRHQDTSAFGPDGLSVLASTFNLAWERLVADGVQADGADAADHKRLLATCIMACAKPGPLDPDDLAEKSIALFNGRGRKPVE